MSTSNILVPTDFSSVAECALIHACTIAAKTGDEVKLLHVITKEIKAELKKNTQSHETLMQKLDAQCAYYSGRFDIRIHAMLKEGSIFNVIGETADREKSQLIVMGTHGVKGIQHIVGAYAIKVAINSSVPVVIVQNRLPVNDGYIKIISPIDATVETRQKTLQTIAIAKMFDAEVYLYAQAVGEEQAENNIKLNTLFVKRHLEEQDIKVITARQENRGADFAKDFIAYAGHNNADLIIILTTLEKGIKDIVLGTEEQRVINNPEGIPVMCVNPMRNLYKTDRLTNTIRIGF